MVSHESKLDHSIANYGYTWFHAESHSQTSECDSARRRMSFSCTSRLSRNPTLMPVIRTMLFVQRCLHWPQRHRGRRHSQRSNGVSGASATRRDAELSATGPEADFPPWPRSFSKLTAMIMTYSLLLIPSAKGIAMKDAGASARQTRQCCATVCLPKALTLPAFPICRWRR